MTAPDEHMQLAAWLRNPWQKCDDTPRGPIPEWQAALMFEAANVIECYAQSASLAQAAVAAAYEAAAQVAGNRWAARKEHAAHLYEMDYPEAKIDSKIVSGKADEAEMIASHIRAIATADQTAALAAERANLGKAVGALRFYANGENWMINGQLDGNSGNYTGGPAKAVLAEIGGA